MGASRMCWWGTQDLLWGQVSRAVGTGPAQGRCQASLPPFSFLWHVPLEGDTRQVRAGPGGTAGCGGDSSLTCRGWGQPGWGWLWAGSTSLSPG